MLVPLLIGYLIGSFFGVQHIIAMVRGGARA